MAREYEMMVVLSPDLTLEEIPDKMESLRGLLSDNGGTVTEIIDWGRRRLAYPIRRFFEGHYVIAEFTSDSGDGNREVERALMIDESVLRHLIVRQDA